MNALPRWAVIALLILLFVVAPCVSPHLGPDDITADADAGAAARDIERIGLVEHDIDERFASAQHQPLPLSNLKGQP